MRLTPGARLGPYAIESALGAGGMGEVYRARDTRLDRGVAVKVLGDAVAHDPQFRGRFEREARAISALNHPHICTLFDVGQESDVPYLVMELLEGETLSERMKRGPLPASQALPIATQIGAALAAAHRVGIIHRDLKPGNIFITRMRADSTGSPHVKLLDFGLARSASLDSGGATTQAALTTAGETVGTIPYMSPEQLEGRPLDARSDIWSFGCVLYEMFAGRRPFAGDSNARLISQILTSEPAPIAQASLDRVIRKCLAKDPEQRWQTAADLTDELQWSGRQETTSVHAPATSTAATEKPPRRRAVTLVAGSLVLAALALVAGYALRPAPPGRITGFNEYPPSGSEWGDTLALSPDGRRLAFIVVPASAGRSSIWIRDLDSVEAPRQLPGTEGAVINLFWSPDGTSIGFFADRKLKTIGADGGPVIELAAADTPGGGTWNRDGVIVYSPDVTTATGLWRVSAGRREATRMSTTPANESHRSPVFLPDGRHLLYVSATSGVLATSLDNPSQHTKVLPTPTSVEFVAPGYLLFVRTPRGPGPLLAQPFDPDKLELSGEPLTIAGDVDWVPFRAYMHVFSATHGGVLAYRSAAAPAPRQFVWVDRHGRELERLTPTGAFQSLVLSPDESRVAYTTNQSGDLDIHVMEVVNGVTHRLTFTKEPEDSPVWSPNGQRLAFRRMARDKAAGPSGMFEVSADGTGTEKLLRATDDTVNNMYPRSYTRDGRTLMYAAFSRPGATALRGGIYLLPLAGDPSPRRWLDTTANEVVPILSPLGNFIAYVLQDAGQEIHVQPYLGRGAKAQISQGDLSEGGVLWRNDERELFYAGPGNRLMAVPIKDGARAGPTEQLFELSPFPRYTSYSVSKDGQRFLVNRPASGFDEKMLTVVTNWLALAKK